MEFITTDQRIAVENFSIGKIYTITFKNSSSITRACIGKGADYVMFQEQAPKMLFTLNMQTAATVDTIEPGTGTGTYDYDDLENKPQINSVTLSGNKSTSDLGIDEVPSVGMNDDGKVLKASYIGGVGSYSWQTSGGGGGTSDYSDLDNKPQINSVTLSGNKTSSDLGLQDTISDLDTIRSGASAGATAVQPAAMQTALAAKQDTLTTAQLAAVNSGIDSTKVAQIETNKNNISIEEVTSDYTAATGYTINSLTKIYKQGKHIFGQLVVSIDSGTIPTSGTTIATTTYKPVRSFVSFCGCGTDEFNVKSIGFVTVSQFTGTITANDTVNTNAVINVQIDYVSQ